MKYLLRFKFTNYKGETVENSIVVDAKSEAAAKIKARAKLKADHAIVNPTFTTATIK